MESLWNPPSPDAAEMIRSVCERILVGADEMTDDIFEASVVAFSDGGMLADASILEEIREFNRSDLVQWLTANIQQPGARVKPYVGPRISAYIEDLSTRGLAPDYVAGWRAALSVAWRKWVTSCVEFGAAPATLIEVLDCSAHSLTQYALDSVTLVREATLAVAKDHAAREWLEMLQMIASGAPITPYLAEERLGYRMNREHLGLVLWTNESEPGDALELAAAAVRRKFHSNSFLVARASNASRWIWISGTQTPKLELVESVFANTAQVQASVGRPGQGLEGFRSSHQEALAAQGMLVRLGSDRRFTDYASVELVDSLTKDRASAQRFVTSTLGQLAGADTEWRQALLTYIQCGFTATRAAERLYLHRNTVERRVSRANEISATKVEDNPAHLAAALLVLDLIPEFGFTK